MGSARFPKMFMASRSSVTQDGETPRTCSLTSLGRLVEFLTVTVARTVEPGAVRSRSSPLELSPLTDRLIGHAGGPASTCNNRDAWKEAAFWPATPRMLNG